MNVKLPTSFQKTNSWQIILISTVLLFFVQLLFLAVHGQYPGVDTGRYTREAQRLLEGEPFQETGQYYLTYVFLVSVFQGLDLPKEALFILQSFLFTLVVTLLHFQIGRAWGKHSMVLSLLFFLLAYPLWKWNMAIMTESLFVSLAMFLTVALLQKRVILTLCLTGLLAFCRPNGWMFAALTPLFLIAPLVKSIRIRLAIGGFLLVGLLLTVWFYAPLKMMLIRQSLAQVRIGTLIWGYWEWAWELPCPDPCDFLQLIVEHPLHFSKLAFTRLGLELSGVRPYFSLPHNLVVGVLLSSVHLLTLIGAWLKRKNRLGQWCSAIVFFQFAIVGATFSDWEGRFAFQVLPFSLPLAATAIGYLWKWIGKKLTKEED